MSIEHSSGSQEPQALRHGPYRRAYERLRARLVSGEVLPHDLSVSFMGNKLMIPEKLSLRDRDRNPIGDFTLPGKSAQITFTDRVSVAVGALFGRRLSRTDNMFIVPVPELLALNFTPFYVPVPELPLHVRVVYGNSPEVADDIPRDARENLAELLNRYRVRYPNT